MKPALPAGPIRTVRVQLPAYADYERELAERLVTEPDESTRMSGIGVLVYLPDVLWLDYRGLEEQAKQAGWTLGKLLGFLAVRGAAALAAEVEGDTA